MLGHELSILKSHQGNLLYFGEKRLLELMGLQLSEQKVKVTAKMYLFKPPIEQDSPSGEND